MDSSDSESDNITLKLNTDLTNMIESDLDVSKKKKNIKELVKKGANVNFKDLNRKSSTVLHLAVRIGNFELVDFLLKQGADVTIRNKPKKGEIKGKTPLELAESFEDPNQKIISALKRYTPSISQSCNQADKQQNLNSSQSTQKFQRPLAATDELSSKQCQPILPTKKRPGSFEDLDDPVKKKAIVEMKSGEYQASGIKSTLHGTIYQLKLLMLFLIKGWDRGYEFSLATEMDDAQKFDDLVFQYKQTKCDELSYIFLQAKHKHDCNNKISIGDLLSADKSSPFMLVKYFLSFLKIRKEFGENSYFIIFTNADFNFIDGTLDIKSTKSGKKKHISLSLNDVSKSCVLKELLGMDDGKSYKLKLNDNFSESFKNKLKEHDEDKRSDLFKTLEEVRELSKKSAKNFDKVIRKFFDNLVFSVKQYNEKDLDKVLNCSFIEGSKEKFNLLNADLCTASFEKKMMKWFKEKEGIWYTQHKAENLFSTINSEINSIISIGYGRAYYEQLIDYGIDFEINQLEEKIKSKNFVSIVTSSPFLSSIKLARKLEKSSDYNKQDSFLFMRSKTLFIPSVQEKIFDSFNSNKTHLLIIEYESNPSEGDAQKLYNKLSTIKTDKTVIVISSADNSLVKKLKEGQKNHYLDINDEIEFSSLNSLSQQKILEKKADFQGYEVELRQLMTLKSHLTKHIPLADLLQGKPLKIGQSVPDSYGYDPDFYIDRTFNLQIINSLIFNDAKLKTAKCQQEFEKLCQNNPNDDVHWLQKESNHWLWKKSRGSLKNVRSYIDTKKTYKVHLDMDERGVFLIADVSGMGKTTLLTHFSKKLKKDKHSCWVVRIDLNNHVHAFDDYKKIDFSVEKAKEFIGQLLSINPESLEEKLFIESFQSEAVVPLILMFDGFDEISPLYKETFINLLTALQDTNIKQLWVTTRSHLKKDLEDTLQQLSFTLEPFSETNQIDFLTNIFRKQKHKFSENQTLDEINLRDYAQQLVKKLSASIKDKGRKFTGIPLHTRMLAETFQDCINSQENIDTWQLPEKLNVTNLYDDFIKRKRKIFSEKSEINEKNSGMQELQDDILYDFMIIHRERAIKSIFDEDQAKILILESKVATIERVCRAGLNVSIDDKYHFIHRTFAEYFVADALMEQLKKQETKESFQNFIVKEFFLLPDYEIVRSFLDGILEKKIIKDHNVFEIYGGKISELFLTNKLCVSHLLQKAVNEGNSSIIQFILNSIEQIKNNKIIFDFLYNDENEANLFLKGAISKNDLKIVKILVERGFDVEKKDCMGKTALHYAANDGDKNLVDWLIKSKYDGGGGSDVHAEDDRRMTPLFYAVGSIYNYCSAESRLEKIKSLVNKGACLDFQDINLPLLHYAVLCHNLATLEYLLDQGADMNVRDEFGSTILHKACEHYNVNEDCNMDIIKLIIARKPSLISSKDESGRTPFHSAAKTGELDIIKFLEPKVGDVKTIIDDEGNNLFMTAVKSITIGVNECEWFIEKGFEIDCKNTNGETLLHIAIEHAHKEVVKWLISVKKLDPNIKDKDENPSIVKMIKFLEIEKDYFEFKYDDYLDIIIYLSKCDIKVDFNAKDKYGFNALHYAAVYGMNEILEELVNVCNIEIKDDEEKLTALAWAAKASNWDGVIILLNHGDEVEEFIEFIAEEAKKILDPVDADTEEEN